MQAVKSILVPVPCRGPAFDARRSASRRVTHATESDPQLVGLTRCRIVASDYWPWLIALTKPGRRLRRLERTRNSGA